MRRRPNTELVVLAREGRPSQALMPYVALLAIVPLGFVLYRRNL